MNLRGKLLPKKNRQYRVHHEEKYANTTFSSYLNNFIPTLVTPVIVVCIGTDRSTGDSLGPLVGTNLKNKFLPDVHIYGTLEEPVHAMNLQNHLNTIKKTYANPFIIGIDACLGKLSNIGIITVANGPVKPGAGVNKQLPSVGDMHITGIVNVSGFMEHVVLQNTRLHLVMTMADFIANGLFLSLYKRKLKTKENKPALSQLET